MLRTIGLLLACVAAHAATSTAPTIAESGGIVAAEVETAAAIGGWSSRTTIAGYSGSAYFHNTVQTGTPGGDILEYPFTVATGGTYQLQLRSRIAEGSSNTEANDSFVRIVNAGGSAVTPVGGANVATSTWYKLYMNVAGKWTWNSSNKDHDPQALAWSLAAGQTYKLQISRRSKGHAVDRWVLWDRARHTLGNEKGQASTTQSATLDAISSSGGGGGGGPVNVKPTVDAGPNRTVLLPGSASLDGSISDDGLPGGGLTTAWTKASGPGTVTFADAAAVDTTAGFSAVGTYVLRLTANDGALEASDTMTVVVKVNAAPTVDAGVAQTVALAGTLHLDGTVSDDGLPGGGVTTAWAKDSGPGTVTFGSAAAVDTTARFSAAGTYVLRLTADDGSASAADTVTITVDAALANGAPNVSAGPDRILQLPGSLQLDGTVTDDALPAPASLTTQWSVTSGPGTVTFADPGAVDTSATFSAAGTYVLSLQASDGDLSRSDSVQVTVAAAPAIADGEATPSAGAGQGGCATGTGIAVLAAIMLLAFRPARRW